MTTISKSMERKIAEYRKKTGIFCRCIENVELDTTTWNSVIKEFELSPDTIFEKDFGKWFCCNSDESTRIWLDILPTETKVKNNVLIYAKPDIIVKLKEMLGIK